MTTRLRDLASIETRAAATAAIVVLAIVVVARVVPSVVERVADSLDRWLPENARSWLVRGEEALPVTASAAVLVAVLQAVVVGITAWALLIVWGQLGLAVTILTLLEDIAPRVGRVVLTGLLIGLAYVGTEILSDIVGELLGEQEGVTDHQEVIVFRVSQISLFVLIGLAVLAVWEVNLGGVLVGAGFLGIVIGLAARQTLGALIAGFVLMFSRPFEIGDWVAVADEEGIVTDVTIINTRLRNFDGEYVVIPNDRVTESVVTNRTREGKLRQRIEVGVDYGSDPQHAATVAEAALQEAEGVVANPQPQVIPTGFGDSSVVLELRFWIDRPTPQAKWRAIANAVTGVKTAFEREGITIPFPQRELSERTPGEGVRIREGEREASSRPANQD